MKTRTRLRLISLAMLIAAIIFAAYALAHPEAGTTIHVGSFVFGYRQYLFFYRVYVIVMAALFGASFFAKEKKDPHLDFGLFAHRDGQKTADDVLKNEAFSVFYFPKR